VELYYYKLLNILPYISFSAGKLNSFPLRYKSEANHNKDYSVVKTFKAGQLAFFHSLLFSLFLKPSFFINKNSTIRQGWNNNTGQNRSNAVKVGLNLDL